MIFIQNERQIQIFFDENVDYLKEQSWHFSAIEHISNVDNNRGFSGFFSTILLIYIKLKLCSGLIFENHTETPENSQNRQVQEQHPLLSIPGNFISVTE